MRIEMLPKLEGEHIALLEEEVEEVRERVGLGHKPVLTQYQMQGETTNIRYFGGI